MTEEENQENNLDNEEETERDVELMEFALNDEDIDELIEKLQKLKENQTSFNFEVDDENEFLVHHEKEEVNEVEEGY